MNRIDKRLIIIIVFEIILLLSCPWWIDIVNGATLRLQLTSDTWLDQVNPGTNYGTAIVGQWGARPNDTQKANSWLKSTLAGLPANASITACTVRVYFTSTIDNPALECSLYACTQVATEAGATWNKYDGTTDWPTPGGDFDTLMGTFQVTFAQNAYSNVALTASGRSVVQKWLCGTRANNGIIGVGRNQAIRKEWQTREGTNPDSLIIVYTDDGLGCGAAPTSTVILGKVFLGGVNIAK